MDDIVLLGTGRMAGRLPFKRVDSLAEIATGTYSAVVATGSYHEVREYTATVKVPWLPLHLGGGWVTIGPLVRPGRPGCPSCVARRRYRNRKDAVARLRLDDPDSADDAAIPPMLAETLARLVAEQFDAAHTRTDGAILRLSVVDGSARRHRFLPDPLCVRCADLPPDTRTEAIPKRIPLPKPRGSFRLHRLDARAAELRDLYVDEETGLIASLDSAWLAGVPTAVARRSPGRETEDSHHGYGRAADHDAARVMAIAEALERGSGERPQGRRTVVRGTFEQFAGDAIDPRALGTPPDELYELPGYPLVPFTTDQETNWVWAYSFARNAPVLVPESVAYYDQTRDPAWVLETSNGCALGSCLEEAILYGLLEVAERDAFLMTWYARLPLPRVDLNSAVDRRIPMMAELIEQRFGCEVMVFAALMEQRVPAFVTFAVGRTDDARPALACGAAAHLSPEHAVMSMLRELGPLMRGLRARYDPDAVAPMLSDSLSVETMDQHAALYAHPAARPRAGFLTGGGPGVTLESIAAQAAWPSSDDLSADLDELVGRYLATGLDVIAVDTTSTEQAAGRFASAKVIVPGTLPMTFGHRFRRTTGLPRLQAVPRLLGFRDRDTPLNPYPHPFS
jgi:ribosomal protein S12 methylthiotransferase accessory factor